MWAFLVIHWSMLRKAFRVWIRCQQTTEMHTYAFVHKSTLKCTNTCVQSQNTVFDNPSTAARANKSSPVCQIWHKSCENRRLHRIIPLPPAMSNWNRGTWSGSSSVFHKRFNAFSYADRSEIFTSGSLCLTVIMLFYSIKEFLVCVVVGTDLW